MPGCILVVQLLHRPLDPRDAELEFLNIVDMPDSQLYARLLQVQLAHLDTDILSQPRGVTDDLYKRL